MRLTPDGALVCNSHLSPGVAELWRNRMSPPIWHQKVLELALLRLSELPMYRRSQAALLFIKHGEIHCRILFRENENADEPSRADYEVAKRIADLKDTPAEAYAEANLVIWNEPSGHQANAVSVTGAERNDPHETEWLQRITFDPESGLITGHECWTHDISRKANALAQC